MRGAFGVPGCASPDTCDRRRSSALKRGRFLLTLALLAGIASMLCCQRGQAWHGEQKLIILGIDGMDPQLLKRFMQEGKMPNFARLAEQGSFRLLASSIPPQSPVAWSNLMTGMDAGGHGIFDFIHRDPKTLQPYFSASRVEGPKRALHLGSWVIPLGGGSAEQLRRGRAFWEILDEHGVPNTIFRKGSPPATELFSVAVDPLESVAKFAVQGQELLLREGEWSDWVRVEFQLIPVFGNVKGMCRFYLKQAHPRFQLYVSPMNIDPSDPALPISTPAKYSRMLSEEAGEFHTQGIAEDTKARSDGMLDDQE